MNTEAMRKGREEMAAKRRAMYVQMAYKYLIWSRDDGRAATMPPYPPDGNHWVEARQIARERAA